MSNSFTSLIFYIKVQSTINDYIVDIIKMKSIIKSLDNKLTYWKSFSYFSLLPCLIRVASVIVLVYFMY